MSRVWIIAALCAAALVVLAFLPFARAVQLGFLCASAVPIGAVLMLAIGRVTGADWSAFAFVARAMPAVVPLSALAMLADGGVPVPEHLRVWQNPLFAAARAVVFTIALAFAGNRLARGASVTFAGVTLALYAAVVTPIATDWLLASDPGHSTSAIGMMLFVEQFGAACAYALLSRRFGERHRNDFAKLLVAAALGLCYLTFMDYLIIWFGNLPRRVGFYVVRGTPVMSVLAGFALVLALAGTILPLALMARERGRRVAGLSALAALFAFDLWWLGGGIVNAIVGALVAALAAWVSLAVVRRTAHG